MKNIDTVIKDLQEIRFVIQLRGANAETKLILLRSKKMDELRSIAENYFAMDCNDLVQLEQLFYRQFLTCIELSEAMDGVTSISK